MNDIKKPFVNSYTIYKRGKEQREHSNSFIYNRGSLQKCTYRHFRRQLIMLTTQTVLEMFDFGTRMPLMALIPVRFLTYPY